jgi:hypothetical protein
MMVSAPDTPAGAAFIHFCQLFARRPLDILRLQEAFASLSALAIQEQPDRPWPTTIRTGNGQLVPFTVEALLAQRSEQYANSPSVPASRIQDLLTRWTGAIIKEVVAGWQGAGFQLCLAKKGHLGPKKARNQDAGSLRVSCTWQLVQKQAVVCSSNDPDLHIKESLQALKGKTILSSQVGPNGHLLVNWQTDSWVEIQPDRLAISPDYHLEFGWDDQQLLLYYCFEGAFVTFEQRDYSEQDSVDE